MAYNPNANIVISGKTFMNVPSVQFKTPDGATVNFAHVGGQIRFSPTLEEQTEDVANYQDVIINPITSTLLNQLDSDFVAENIKKDVDLFGLLGTLEAGGGINATAGTLNVSSDTNDYILTHGLGEVPKFFAIGMINNFTLLTNKNSILIGAYGFSDVDIQYRITSSSSTNAANGVLGEGAITDAYPRRCSLTQANEETIKIATSSGTHKLIAGATYYWVAVGSGVF